MIALLDRSLVRLRADLDEIDFRVLRQAERGAVAQANLGAVPGIGRVAHDHARIVRHVHPAAPALDVGDAVLDEAVPELGLPAGAYAAFKRDIDDPKTVSDFCALVQSPERLRLLLVLTVADVRAVGPGVWTGWKGQLLRTLYFETEPLLGGGHTTLSRSERVSRAQEALRERLSDWPERDFERFVHRHAPSYWLRTDIDTVAAHAKVLRAAEAQNKSLVTHISTDAFRGVTEITLFAPNHPRLLAMVAGACAGAGANIVDAQISTTRDGMALDTIHLEREFDRAEDEERRARKITGSIERLLRGEARLADVIAGKKKPRARLSAFTVEPQVIVDNTLSDALTVIEINGLDRPGFLHDITREISDLNLDIASAHIATFGEKAVDVFYVTDLTGKKITSSSRETAIRERLMKALAGRLDAVPA